SLLDDFICYNISIIGLQETKLAEPNGSACFKSYVSLHNSPYKAYWSFDPLDRAGGVSLIIADFVSKYIQKIHRYGSRFIAVDLFLPAKKLKIINIYNYTEKDSQSLSSRKRYRAFTQFVISHIKSAESENFTVIIMGDFNLDPTS